jgi:hypothetical protein
MIPLLGSRRWFIVRVVALWLLCVAMPLNLWAEQQEGLTYDTSSEAMLTGTVADIRGRGPGRLGWLMRVHTLGLMHKAADTAELLLKTDTDTVRIQLGPAAFLNERKVDIRKGDRLIVTGPRVPAGDSQVMVAREIRKGDTVWALRTAAGQPLWSTTEPEKRRFWTTTKVVLVVVSAKVALLATVLRH